LRKAERVRASEMTVLVHNCHRTTCSFHAGLRHNGGRSAPKRRPVCTQTATYVAHFFQANFELHPYDVEKWAASRWNHRQLKIGRRQLDLTQVDIISHARIQYSSPPIEGHFEQYHF
jgi:hypothetical protein